MPRYKPLERNGLLLHVVLSEQIQPGSFEFALDHLVDYELDLSAMDARYCNDETGASAYDPRAMLKIVLLAYSRGLISSRRIAQACQHNIQFIALSGDSRPSYTHIAKFVRELGPQVRELFAQVLITCDRMQLIGREMFAIDGVKLPSNASKERNPVRLMREAIDSAQGRALYSQRMGTVEPVFGNLRHNKGLDRFTLRGTGKVGTQWNLYCMVQNIEKLAGAGYGR